MYSREDVSQYFEKSKQYFNQQLATIDDGQKAILDLVGIIQFHEWRYYIKNDPIISDFEYDQLFKLLEALEQKFPDLKRPDSPTIRVSSDLVDEFKSVKHLIPMLSLANSYNEEDLLEFDKQIKKLTNLTEDEAITYCVEPKYDGGSIALVYDNDILVRGATRGNGEQGEEITLNTKVMRSIPLSAKFSKYNMKRVELRGEALIRKDVFKKINEEREKEGLSILANPRNSAAGGLRTKDPKETAKRRIEAFIYQLGFAEDGEENNQLGQFNSHFQSIEFLDSLGFKVPKDEKKKCLSIKEVVAFCKAWEIKRDQFPYEIDGMVVKVDDLELQKRCGYTAHHPRWAIAYKFKAKQATTKLIDVSYQVGKIGSITPVAKLDPVSLAGVTVSSVSLHNEDFIVNKDLRIGDTVLVERAGDVIPYIVKPMDELRDGSEKVITFPVHCPINDTDEKVELQRIEGESAWRCPNCVCGAQDLQRMIFHVSKDAMDIDGFGKSIVERFYEVGWIRNMADIYDLDYESIAKLDGFGNKSANKLKLAIEKAKNNPVYRILHSLSIHHLGKKASKLIANEIDHVLDLKNWQAEDYTNIKEIGPVLAKNMVSFFSNDHQTRILVKMEENGVDLNAKEADRIHKADESAPLFGKSILFTGALQKMGRKEAQKLAETAGAKNISAVSSKLDILVVGEKAGSKLKKAQSIGTVRILTEDEFISIINQ